MPRLLLPLLLTLAATAAAQERLAPGDHERHLRHGTRDRYYLVHVPPQASTGEPLPVVLCYHGGGGAPEGTQEKLGLDAVADREGFVVVYPAGTGRFERRLLTWNAGRCCGSAARENVDDVGYTWAALADLASVLPLDQARVYATGLSNGAMMSYRLAVETPERVAAIVPVAGAMLCDPPRAEDPPTPVMHVHSVDDPRALYTGGLGPPFPFTKHRVDHAPVRDVVDRWVAHNGCAPGGEIGEEIQGVEDSPDAGHSARKIVWGPGRDGAEVVLWRLRGAGHVWPGAEQYGPARLVGEPSRVIDANDELWAFCRRFTRADAPPLQRD
jgi:polyhydroxybutyrate depolymerase